MIEKLLTLKEAAPYIGLEVQTIYDKISKRQFPIPFVKTPGGRIRFKPSEIEKYQQRYTVRPLNHAKTYAGKIVNR